MVQCPRTAEPALWSLQAALALLVLLCAWLLRSTPEVQVGCLLLSGLVCWGGAGICKQSGDLIYIYIYRLYIYRDIGFWRVGTLGVLTSHT